MSIKNQLSELVEEGIIDQETGIKIHDYFSNKQKDNPNRLFIVFGVLGAVLIGLGIVLILAHNWDSLSKITKTIIAIIPLLIGQLLCAFARFKKQDSIAWTESASTFLFFGIAASISLISQIYNINGSMASFVLTWMLLALPLVYIMNSSVISVFYIIGITYYGAETQYWTYPKEPYNFYWLLLLLIIPHNYSLFKNRRNENSLLLHNWLIPISILIMLASFASKQGVEIIVISYASLLGLMYLIGDLDIFANGRLRNNSYKVIGSIGTVILLLILSFDGFWESVRKHDYDIFREIMSIEFLIGIVLSALALFLLFRQKQGNILKDIKPITPVFLLFPFIYFIGTTSSISLLLVNLLIFVIGVLTIREGASKNHLGILNYGLLIITLLIICRFFDTNLSFVFRGILFVGIGIGFFMVNYWMLKKRNINE